MSNFKETITITFSEMVENHNSMQKVGTEIDKGFSVEQLREIADKYDGEFINLNTDESQEPACIVIFRDGLTSLFGVTHQDAFDEQAAIKHCRDKKAFMYGRVVNKKARHNLCFADFDQVADYENKKGTILDFKRLDCLQSVREKMGDVFGADFANLLAEGNYYYDVKNTYIGFHGDAERRKVVGLRLGAPFDLHYRWFKNGEGGDVRSFTLNGGDMYIMSDKATGNDWKKKKGWTIRHAAGDLKHLM